MLRIRDSVVAIDLLLKTTEVYGKLEGEHIESDVAKGEQFLSIGICRMGGDRHGV